MERVINQDERIRRAEEIYARRQMQLENRKSATVNVEGRTDKKLTKKLIIQSIICLIIYGCYYGIKNIPNFVSEDVMYKISDILEYDINVQEMYNKFNKYINKNSEATEEKSEIYEEQFIEETLSATDDIENTNNAQTETINEIQTTEENVEENVENTSELSQMEIDAKYILENFSIIKPLDGEITSRFGPRNPTVPTVPKYHTGIDIARIVGTEIIAAMEGDVELISSEGDYGNHVKITNGDVSTVYAHCNKIYVEQGEHVIQGQQIAEVGATGNVTGPHLHFEIRRNDIYVDPDLILEF